MNIIKGNVLDAGTTYIVHQVNCQGVMGAGLAKQIKERYPNVFKMYRNMCILYAQRKSDLLGTAQIIPCDGSNSQFIVNVFAQVDYGRSGLYTNYDAFRVAMEHLAITMAQNPTATVAFPYMIGCGLAGGDWNIISRIIEDVLPGERVKIYQLEAA